MPIKKTGNSQPGELRGAGDDCEVKALSLNVAEAVSYPSFPKWIYDSSIQPRFCLRADKKMSPQASACAGAD
jgi:hypothetical protein